MRSRFPLLAVAVAIGMLAACQISNDSSLDDLSDSTSSSEPDGDSPSNSTQEIEWSPCEGAECAAVTAPLDYADPDGATIDIFVARIPATGERHGALWVNFGGPGGRASTGIVNWPVPPSIAEHFDIIGMDPRGVGFSSPLECGVPTLELYAADPTIDDPTDVDALIDVSQRYIDDCATTDGDRLSHLGTRNVARDMDLIRSMMGDEQINYLGYSYGSMLGQTYGELFPDRVRTMVLDGIVDPGLSGPDLAAIQATGFEQALARWAETCDSRDCPLNDPVSAVDRVLNLAEGGIPTADGLTVGPGEAANALAFPLFSQHAWPLLDDAIDSALSLDGSGLMDLAVGYSTMVNFSIYYAVSCLDSDWPDDPQELLDASKAAAVESPRFGEAIVNDYIRCALWPSEPEPLGPLTLADTPPILVVSTTGDSATPHENGITIADRVESAVLLTYEGEGHTVSFRGGSACVDQHIVDYIVNETIPSDDVIC